jgi:hypothetical protein
MKAMLHLAAEDAKAAKLLALPSIMTSSLGSIITSISS